MKAIKCELCGSNELVKEDDYFVCKYCGTKYSTQEAKKMLVEGTIKIDESNKLNNMLKNAEDLYYDGKIDEAYKLFGDVLNIDIKCSKAILYRGLCSTWKTSVANPTPILDCIKSFEKALKNEERLDKGDERYIELCEIGLKEINRLYIAINKIFMNNYQQTSKFSDEIAKDAISTLQKYGMYADLDFEKKRVDNANKKAMNALENAENISSTLAVLYASAIRLAILNNNDKKFDLSFLINTRNNYRKFSAKYANISKAVVLLWIELDNFIFDTAKSYKGNKKIYEIIESMMSNEQWDDAEKFCNKAIELDKENPNLWLLMLIISEKWKINDGEVYFPEAVSSRIKKLNECAYYDEVQKYINKDKETKEKVKEIEKARSEFYYKKATTIIKTAETSGDYQNAIQNLKEIEDYKDSKKLIEQCEKKYEEKKNQELYEEIVKKTNSSNINELLEAKKIIEENRDWKDADVLITKIDERVKKRRNILQIIIFTISVVTIILIVTSIAIVGMWKKSQKYDEANYSFDQKNYERATEIYSEIKNYKDSKEKLEKAEVLLKSQKEDYGYAKSVLEQGSSLEAYTRFKEIGIYSDNLALAREAYTQYLIEGFGRRSSTGTWEKYFNDYETIKDDDTINKIFDGDFYQRERRYLTNEGYGYDSVGSHVIFNKDGSGTLEIATKATFRIDKITWNVKEGTFYWNNKSYEVRKIMDDVYILNERIEKQNYSYTSEEPSYILIKKDSICQKRLEQKLSKNESTKRDS